MSELKPCPFCQCDYITLRQDERHRCEGCGTYGPAKVERSHTDWNTRTAPPLPEGATGQEVLTWWPLSVKPDVSYIHTIFLLENGSQLPIPGHWDGDEFWHYDPLSLTEVEHIPQSEYHCFHWTYAPKGPETE
jgi:hypothetical protein